MQVELDAFSGRPNPYWNLTLQEARDFMSRFQSLPQYQGEGSVREGLGYRGLIVTKPGECIEGYDRILVSNELVVAENNTESRQFVDRDRQLERWLLHTGRGRLDETIYEAIGKLLNDWE